MTYIPLLLFGLVAGAGYTAYVLAEAGQFNGWVALTAGGGLTTFLITLAVRKKVLIPVDRNRWTGWILAALIMISLRLSLPAGELLLGGWDPGVYLHTAASIARDGNIQLNADDYTALPPDQLRAVSRDLYSITEPFLGMRLLPNQRLSPQFYHFFPSLLAVAYDFFGIGGALSVNAILQIGSILILYALISRTYGWKAGLLASAALMLNPAQLWQSRFPTAELLTQFLLLTGAFWLCEVERSRHRIFAATLAGIALGLAWMTRYDTILILVPLLALLLWHTLVTKQHYAYLITFSLTSMLGIHAWLHMRILAPYYHPLPGLVLPFLKGFTVTGLVIIGAALLLKQRQRDILLSGIYKTRFLYTAAFILYALWGWFIRPQFVLRNDEFMDLFQQAENTPMYWIFEALSDHNAWNFVRLKVLFGFVGLAMGIAGIAIILLRCRETSLRIWSFCSMLVMAVLTLNIFNDQFMMWLTRRFVPVILPLIIIGYCATTALLAQLAGRRKPTYATMVYIAAFLLLTGFTVRQTAAMARNRDWPGLTAWYHEVNEALPADAFILCDQPGFAAPLRFLYGHRSYELHLEECDDPEAVESLAQHLAAQTTNTFYLSLNGPPDFTTIRASEHSHHPLYSHIQHHPKRSVPKGTKKRGGHFILYRLSAE